MALKRRLVGVLFMTALAVGLLWSCLEIVQTDILLSEVEGKRGQALPVPIGSQSRLRQRNRAAAPSTEFMDERSPRRLYNPPENPKGSQEGDYRYYLENNEIPRVANGKKALQAVYQSKPLERDQEDNPRAVNFGTDVHATTSSSPSYQAQLNELSNPETVKLLREKKQMDLRIKNDIKEMWWYLRAQLGALKKDLSPNNASPQSLDRRPTITSILTDIEERYNSLNYRLQKSERVSDELLWPGWKSKLSSSLGDLMERRLRYLQNPSNCSAAKKLVCSIAKTCGFGCQLHHVTYCFILAYATERTLVINSRGWQYSEHGWESAFLPPSSTCTMENTGTQHIHPWRENVGHLQVISVPNIESISPKPKQLPQAIPRDLADQLLMIHGYPFVWFLGQFVRYLMRPNRELQEYISRKREAMGFKHPIVGIHVRRTDKIKSEAKLHELEEYMDQVDEWYRERERGEPANTTRRVFIASDDPRVLQQAITKYPAYVFVSDTDIASSASVKTRYSKESLFGVIFDVMTLAESDYLVCTFSSQVCRLAYELMQSYHVDASHNYYSLDDVYYFGGQQGNNVKAIQDHRGRNPGELSFAAGDLIAIAGNEKNGLSVGKLQSSLRQGVFPSYKVEEETLIVDFPTYPDVP